VARLSSSVGDVFPRTFGRCPFGRFRATTRRAILCGQRNATLSRRKTHRVAIVVYDSTAPAGTGKGVYMEARADEQEIIHALHALERREWKKSLQEVREASIHRVYKAVPEHRWISTVGSLDGQRFDTRVPVDLLGKWGVSSARARGRPSRGCGRQKARQWLQEATGHGPPEQPCPACGGSDQQVSEPLTSCTPDERPAAESPTTMCIALTERSAEGEEREAGEL
jgi:hypothetical protein